MERGSTWHVHSLFLFHVSVTLPETATREKLLPSTDNMELGRALNRPHVGNKNGHNQETKRFWTKLGCNLIRDTGTKTKRKAAYKNASRLIIYLERIWWSTQINKLNIRSVCCWCHRRGNHLQSNVQPNSDHSFVRESFRISHPWTANTPNG